MVHKLDHIWGFSHGLRNHRANLSKQNDLSRLTSQMISPKVVAQNNQQHGISHVKDWAEGVCLVQTRLSRWILPLGVPSDSEHSGVVLEADTVSV